MIEKVIKIIVDQTAAVGDIKQVNKELENTNKTTADLNKGLMDGVKNFEVMGVSINSVSKSLKVLRVSLIATGIGAIVVAVGALAAAFLSTQKGVDELNKVLVPLKEVLGEIWEIMEGMGEGLYDMVRGDVAQGWNKMADAVDNVGDSMDQAWKRGQKLLSLQNQIRDNASRNFLVISRLDAQAADLLAQAEEANITDKEKQALLDKWLHVKKAAYTLQMNDLKLAEEEARTRLKNDADQADAQKEINTIIAQQEDLRRTLSQAEKFRNRKETDDKIENIKKVQAKEKAKTLQVKENGLAELKYQKEINTAKIDQEIAYRAEMDELARISKENEEAYQEEKFNNMIDTAKYGLEAITAMTEEGSALHKAAAIGSVLVDAAAAIVATWKGYSAFGPWGTASAVAQTAFIAATAAMSIKEINAVKKPSASGGQSGSSGGGGGSPTFNVVAASSTNQLNEALVANNIQPVKAYVVSSEVTTAQALDRKIQTAATF
jgi:hypothetical protein